LLLVLTAALLSFGAAALYAHQVASDVDQDAADIGSDAAPAIKHLAQARSALLQIELRGRDAVEGSRRGAPVDPASVERALADCKAALAAYAAIPFFAQEQPHYRDAEQSLAQLDAQVSLLLQQLEHAAPSGAAALRRAGFSQAVLAADRALGALVSFNADQQARLGADIPGRRLDAERAGYVLQVLTAMFAAALLGTVVRAARQHARYIADQKAQIEQRAEQLVQLNAKLETLVSAFVIISANVTAREEVPTLLRTIADEARRVVSARAAALGCGSDPERPFDVWVASGLSAQESEHFEAAPSAAALLAPVASEGRALRLEDAGREQAYAALARALQPLGPLLAVPILHDGRNVGGLYLARSPGEPPFSADDEHVAKLLASYAGVALENARLYRKAREATRAREDLLATVSHDLKNPLHTIRISSQLLQAVAAEGRPGQLAQRIERSCDQMAKMVQEQLDSARIEAGLLRAELEPEDVHALLDSAVELFAMQASEKSLRLSLALPDESVAVPCERDLLLRVFSNLIGNAIKFTPAGGSVSVGAQQLAGQVQFSIVDTGPGIPSDRLPHVFERYWQEKPGDRRGSGLGLYIAKGIVEAHGGRIWVESTPGSGTAFHFQLPIELLAGSPQKRAPAAPSLPSSQPAPDLPG
jgi:signal transduction histidine kinase